MNQPVEQQTNKQIKIETSEFKDEQEFQAFIQRITKDTTRRKNQETPNTCGIAKDKFKIQTIHQEQDYQQFIEEEYKKFALPQDQKLEELKLNHIDKEIKGSNKEQLMYSKKEKFDFACQTEIENIQEQKTENFKQIQTKNSLIQIKEQIDRSNNFEDKRDQYQQILSSGQIYNSSQQLKNSKQNENQTTQNIGEQLQQNQQLIKKQIQQSSNQINKNFNTSKQKNFDQIIDKKGNLKMKLKRFKLILFEDGIKQQSKKNQRLEEDYQNSLDNENRKLSISEQSYPIIKYNQQIGLNDKDILLKSNLFLTSSIINAYSNYLQAKDEHYYFSLNKDERIKHKRLFIFNSDFLTNCNLELYHKNNEKAFYLILQYLQDFKVIQYQFWLIYQKIAFIVNSKNIHWYLAVIDFKDGCLKIYDSLPKHPNYYNSLNNLLSSLFQKLSQQFVQFVIFVCPTWNKQQDHYSCGYHTCIALEYLSQYVANRECRSLEEIKNILKKLLINEENQHNQQLNQ
ncbi:unnamed protein product [Paramecium pentaurelia]|uniref:Ubiquitin-like protease family profile domain-containing protein n=1 Tax=Paramecium pentaurelia TaxID=43138 RepID=A0A8S1VBY7_9CILI|nr:unnamed protein product [Paramecium pentaurelia]